jgi:hypothetical protein
MFDFEIFQNDFHNPVAIFEQLQIIFQIARRDQFRIALVT